MENWLKWYGHVLQRSEESHTRRGTLVCIEGHKKDEEDLT